MANDKLIVLLPPGRMVQGSMYEGQTEDFEGRPKVYKPGHPKAGQPQVSWFFAVAIPKNPGEGHWASTPWGQQIWEFGHRVWPNGQAQTPGFAWKIEDGDSTIPNKKNNKNAEREGHPGNWIVKCSSGYAPRVYVRDAGGRSQELLTEGAVMPGDFIQVQTTVDTNDTAGNAGIYINHQMVMFLGHDAVNGRIRMGANPNDVQWAAPPQGASYTPPAGGTMPASAPPPPANNAAPPPPAGSAAPPPPGGTSAAPPPPGQAVKPSATFAPPPPPPGNAAPPPPPSGPQMTAKAAGNTYEAMIGKGWTDAQLREHGYMA